MIIENEFTLLQQNVKEVRSSLLVLQQAVQNENDFISLENIDDNLELIVQKLNMLIDHAEKIADNLFS